MNEQPMPTITVQGLISKWPTERLAQIQDPLVREMLVDIVNVVWEIESEAKDASYQADRARSRATWGIFGGW